MTPEIKQISDPVRALQLVPGEPSERRIITIVQNIVQHDEVPDFLVQVRRQPVKVILRGRAAIPIREIIKQPSPRHQKYARWNKRNRFRGVTRAVRSMTNRPTVPSMSQTVATDRPDRHDRPAWGWPGHKAAIPETIRKVLPTPVAGSGCGNRNNRSRIPPDDRHYAPG